MNKGRWMNKGKYWKKNNKKMNEQRDMKKTRCKIMHKKINEQTYGWT